MRDVFGFQSNQIPEPPARNAVSVNGRIVTSQDPNDLIGPAGVGAGNFVTGDGSFPYRIDFENDPTATAPAQAVTVRNQLDPNLDWNTFELTGVGFGDTILTIPPGSQSYQTTVTRTINGKSVQVQIRIAFSATGLLTATFQSLDPATLLPPDVLTGFLPAEDGTGRGQGFITYIVNPKSGLPSGTAIRNVAIITFDGNAPIATDQKKPHDPSQGIDPAKQALVTIDATPPTATVNPLPATEPTATFPVSWSGSDGAGSGIASYDVFASDNGGPFTAWLTGTPQTTASYPGQNGHNYRFYAVATDAVGRRETTSGTAEATTTVSVSVPPPPPAAGSPGLVGYPQFAVGFGAGGSPTVRFFNPDASQRSAAIVFDSFFTGGVRTASADFTGDGVADYVAGTGPGSATEVAVYDGATGQQLFRVAPFEAAFIGGVYVAAGDVDGDGKPELIVTPDEGGGPRVQIYRGTDFTKVVDFFGIDDPNFRGGARAAIGDVTGDGAGDLVISAGFGGGPRISIYDGRALTQQNQLVHPVSDFFLFEPALRNGAFVAVGDIDGDGFADVVGGGGPGGGPRVYVLSGKELLAGRETPLANFFAGNTDNRGGIRVAVKNLDGDAKADLVVGDGTGAGSRVTAYRGKDFAGGSAPEAFAFDAAPGFTGGVFVG